MINVGVFDSGIGGITVLNGLRTRFPQHRFTYFGDTANVPYGTKSVAQIQTLCESAARRMKERGLDALVVACNTASSLALEIMRGIVAPVPVMGVVESGVRSVLDHHRSDLPVLVLGTRATIKSRIYSQLLEAERPGLRVVERECPLLVPMIEEGWRDHPILAQTVDEYVHGLSGTPPGIALLACTHYPWILHQFERALPGWRVVDSATAVARFVERSFGMSVGAATGSAQVEWFFSDPDAVTRAPLINGDAVQRF